MTKTTLSKTNENPAQKMQVMSRTIPLKTKLLKFNWFPNHFWSLENRLCAAPKDPPHQTRRAKQKNSGQESQVANRAPAAGKRGPLAHQAFRRGRVAKNGVRKSRRHLLEDELRDCKNARIVFLRPKYNDL